MRRPNVEISLAVGLGLGLFVLYMATLGYGQPLVRPFSGLYSFNTCAADDPTQLFAINLNLRLATVTNEALTSVRLGLNDTLTSSNGQRLIPGLTAIIRGSDYLGSVWCISEGPGGILASVSLVEEGR